MIALLVAVVDACRRRAAWVALAGAVATLAGATYVAQRIDIDTDATKLMAESLPWRQRELAFDRAFPQNVGQLVIVVDGATADQAEDATAALFRRLESRGDLVAGLRRPDANEFFQRNGLLYLSVDDLTALSEQVIAAQPMIGALAVDPSLRGLFAALDLAMTGVATGEADAKTIERALTALAEAAASAVAGSPRPLAWSTLLTGRAPSPEELRRFILVQPRRDFTQLASGAAASGFIRDTARELGLTPASGVRVRLTGSVALADEEFATLAEGAGTATLLSFVLVTLLLYLALRSWRSISAILLTLIAGLVATAAFATIAVGRLNPISIAFAVLFVGIAVDFSIQFSIRYRDLRFRVGDPATAMRGTAREMSVPLGLAALTTALGFLSFVPTDYVGVSELGMIAGAGMVIALILNFTLLPALLTLFRTAGAAGPLGFAWTAPIDRFLLRRRWGVLAAALAAAALGLALLPSLRFDFDPLNLKDPKAESVAVLFELMQREATTPFTIDVLAPTPSAAAELAPRLAALPEVAQVVSIASFVPSEQDRKLPIIEDLRFFLEGTLSLPRVGPPPSAEEVLAALPGLIERLRSVLADTEIAPAATRLADSLEQARRLGAAGIAALDAALLRGLEARIEALRLAVTAAPVALDTLPEALRRDWVATDGTARLEVFPKGSPRDNATIARFVTAVRGVAPDAVGTPVSILESGRTVAGAFKQAILGALAAIALTLLVATRRPVDVLLVLAPLLLAGLMAVAASVLADLPLNFANVITLPLMLGIGVAFAVYFVVNWRAGWGDPLQSSTARAVLFSGLTTAAAFGSLALSSHPGTADMGKLLSIILGFTLLASLLVLPALLGPPPRAAPK